MSGLAPFDVLSFDCYGTLIDWETGLLAALRPVLAARGVVLPDEQLLEHYAQHESRLQQGAFLSYRAVLRKVVEAFAQQFHFAPTAAERRCLEDSLPAWPAFPDTAAALWALQRKYKLAVLSNIDDDLFAGTARQLGVKFDLVITAQQIGAYKPSLENFRALMQQTGVPPMRLLHAAQSLYHDIAPARQLGVATVWVNRRVGRRSFGATPPAEARPDFEVPDLQTLARWCGAAC